MLLLFVFGFLFAKKEGVRTLYRKTIHSGLLFAVFGILSLGGLIVILGTLLDFFGAKTILFERALPVLVLAFLVAFEIFVFQMAGCRYLTKWSGRQPILQEEDRHTKTPLKQNLVLYLAIITVPLLATALLISVGTKSSLVNFQPTDSDEIVYWQEITTFKELGFAGGYFSIDELTSSSSFSHFGTHGPVFAVVCGTLAKIFGWRLYSAPIFNLAAITLALALFLVITRPDKRQSVLLLLIAGLYFPILLFLPTLYQESLHQAIAILLAAFLIRLARNEPTSILIKAAALLTLAFGASLRITWVLVAFPLFYFFSAKRSKKWTTLSLSLAFLFALGMTFLYLYWTSKIPGGILYRISHQDSLGGMAGILLANVRLNLRQFLKLGGINGLEIVFHYQFLAVLALYMFNRAKRPGLSIANLFLLAASFVLNILFYDSFDFHDYRSLAPLLLISLLTLPFFANRSGLRYFTYAYLLSNLLVLGIFCQSYSYSLAGRLSTGEPPADREFAEVIQGLQYQTGASPWCNSLLTTYPLYDEIRLLPPGIGINLLLQTDVEGFTVKSHYVFAPRSIVDRNSSLAACDPLYATEDKVLCVRTDDGCGVK